MTTENQRNGAMVKDLRKRPEIAHSAYAKLVARVVLFFGFATAIVGQSFVVFDVPNAFGTQVYSINASGTVAGRFTENNALHGFVRDQNGNFAVFDPPNSIETSPAGINDGGDVAGSFFSATHTFGFVRNSNGNITVIDVPNSRYTTTAAGINNAGEITGSWDDDHSIVHGFVRDRNGSITVFDVPNASVTSAAGINNAGEITGSWDDGHFIRHGFVRDRNGSITVFDVPNAAETLPISINNGGEIAGEYVDVTNRLRNFLRDRNGDITLVDPNQTYTYSGYNVPIINNRGEIVAYFGNNNEAANGSHGFVRDQQGNISVFDAPNASSAATVIFGCGTCAQSINDSGDVAGFFVDASQNNKLRGFVRSAHH